MEISSFSVRPTIASLTWMVSRRGAWKRTARVRRIRSNIMFLDNMFMKRKLLRTYLERKKHDKRAWNVSSKEQKSMVAG